MRTFVVEYNTKVISVGANQVIISTDSGSVLYSYGTPVAVDFHNGNKPYKLDRFYSKTTSKHVNRFIGAQDYVLVSEPEFSLVVNAMV